MNFWPKLIAFVILSISITTSSEQTCNNWAKISSSVSGIQIGDLDVSGNQITVEATFNRTAPYSGPQLYAGDLVSKHEGPSSANYLLRPNSGEITTTNGYFKTPDICDIQLNKTYHVAMVYNGKILKFYRNGFLMSSITCSGNLFQNNYITTIGSFAADPNRTNENLIGYINEVRIWNVARSQSEIRQYMNQSLPNPLSQAGLLAYYTFDNLKNKQGNSQWDGSISGDALINQTNPTCSSFIADSCNVKPVNVTAGFTGPDTVCTNTPVQFANTSQNASNYLWSFCSDFKTTPTVTNIGNPGNKLNVPVFIDYALDDNGNYYGLVTNHLEGKIIRLNFGNSLLNKPTAENLGSFSGVIPEQVEGIKIERVNGNWYAIAVGGGNDNPNSSPRIIKLDFGNSLANKPVATNWGNIGNLDLPLDFHIINEGGIYYGFTMNVYSNTITRFDFGADFINPPNGINLGNIGNLDYPDGFAFINNNSKWYAFVVNAYSNNITRLDFGSSLTSIPTPTIINNPGNLLNGARDIAFLSTCNGIFGYIINANDNKLFKLNFGSDITDINPATNDLGSFDFNFPHSLSNFFTENGDIYSFVPNANGYNLDRMKFAGCNTIPGSIKHDPDLITYTEAGNYNVNLMVDIGLPTQTSFCKSIVVNSCLPPITASFTAPDTVCKSSAVTINNTSSGITNYLWSFCGGFNTNPVSVKLGNPGNLLNVPVFIDYALDDNGNYYGLVTNHLVGKITRLNFGNSLLNTPSAEDLGNFSGVIPEQVEGIKIERVNGNWYAIAVGGGNDNPNSSPRIIKLDFGNSLTNIPVATNWGNLGDLDLPLDFHIINDNGIYYGFTMNVYSNTITRFDFGTDFINPPAATNLGNIGNLDYPDGFTFIKNSNTWYALAVNTYSNSITRLNFGSSLNNNEPISDVIGNPGDLLSKPRDIIILNTCDGIFGYVLNAGDNKTIKLNFGSDITSIPSATSLGHLGNFNLPHSFSDLFTEGNNIYTFIPTANSNALNRIEFDGCQEISGSTKKNPDPITYDSAGVFTINLMADIGLPTQSSFCKQIVVNNCDSVCNLKAAFSYQQTTCDPKIIQFNDSTVNADSVRWDFGNGKTDTARNPVVAFKTYGQYTVHLYAKTNAGCADTATDTINVNIKIDSAVITRDTSVCLGDSIMLSAIKGLNYCWSPQQSLSDSSIQNPIVKPTVTTTYYLNILTAPDQPVIHDSVTIKVLSLPIVNAGPDDSVCRGSSTQLNATGASAYKWNYSTYLSDSTIANPVASPSNNTSFIVSGIDDNGCVNIDTVSITVLDLPVITLVNDTAICKNDAVLLEAIADGNNSYTWSPDKDLSASTIYNPIASPQDTTKYVVAVTDKNNCVAFDSVMVNVLPRPVVSTINDTSICLGSIIKLNTNASYANIFSWSPPADLDNSNIQNPSASPLSTTKYYVQAGNGVCAESDSVIISVLSLPQVIAGNDTTVCGNAAAQLNVSGAISYSWQPTTGLSDPSIPNPVAEPGVTTKYFVTGTGENNCRNVDSTVVTVIPAPVLTIDPQNAAICFGDSIVITATGGDNYVWSPSSTVLNAASSGTTAFPLTSTKYKVVITNSVCKITDSLFADITVKDLPDITVSKSNDIDCVNLEAQLIATGGISFKWTPDNYISDPQRYNPIVNPSSDTWYFVNVKGENGCRNEDSILVKSTANPDAAAFEVPNAFTPNHDGLNDCFSVKYWGPADFFDMAIYDRWGYLVYHSNNINSCWNGTVNGKPQAAGTYVYKISVSSKCSNGLVHKKGTIVLIR